MRSAWWLCCVATPTVAVCAAPTVVVDANTAVILGDRDQISASMFGLTAFEGFPAVIANRDYRARVAAIRPGCIRVAGNLAWCSPKEYDPAWYATPEAARTFSQVLLFGARYPTGRFLPVMREMGAEPMCSLGSPPEYLIQEGTRHPSDFGRWAEYCAAYVALWKQFDPDLRLVQIWNEPNASWYNDPRVKQDGPTSAELHIEMANQVARAIKARCPDIQVGGPVLCWPPGWPPAQEGHRPWYTWDSWAVPWLRDTKETTDFFDFHVYDVAPDDFAVQAEMVANQALLSRGEPLPIWITESSTNLKPEEFDDPQAIWRKRFLPYERLLLRGMLPQADKVAGNLYHDLHARHHTLLPRGADDPDPMYWLFWILRDLRGCRIVADSTDPDLLSFATLEEDCVTVVLFNDSEELKRVSLSVSLPGGWWTGPYVRAVGEGADGACARLEIKPELERKGGTAEGTVELPGHATASISFRLSAFITPRRARVSREHFGDQVLQFVEGTEPIVLTIAVPKLEQGARATLRLGLLGPEGTEPLAASLNGADLPVRPTALQDVPLDGAVLREANELRVWLREPVDNPRMAVGFASVVVQTRL